MGLDSELRMSPLPVLVLLLALAIVVFLVTQFTLLRLFQSLEGAEFSLAEAFVGVLLVVVFIVSILQSLRTPAPDAK